MNFLELVKRTCGEVGISPLTTVVNNSGEALRMVNWLNAAYTDICQEHGDWGFLLASTSFTTINLQASYTPAEAGTSNFSRWASNTFRNYPTATGTDAEIEMCEISYETWRARYQFGSSRTSTSQPYEYCITPAKSIGLGPVPPIGYTVTAEYFTVPAAMTVDASTHSIPSKFELILVYRAMMSYGEFEAAPEVFNRGQREYSRLMSRMRNEYLPPFESSDPLL